ncbi:MAG: bacteriohemerythrin [Magnetospirillum sp. WYHS-4]
MATESVEWNRDLEIGIPFIDADHRTLISLLNQVAACVAANEETLTVGSVLNSLDDYVRLHFGREESLQEACGYPGLAAHRNQHQELCRRLDGVRQRFHADPAQVSLGDVHRLLKDWFARHIQAEDIPLREHCAANREAIARAAAMRLGGDGPDWSQRRILVLDDNPNFTRLVETVLAAIGVGTVYTAGTAREAMAHLARHNVDLILVDWVMDDTDGLDFVRGLKRDGIPCPTIMVTGYARTDYRTKAMAAGVSGILEKPISARALVRAMGEALAK